MGTHVSFVLARLPRRVAWLPVVAVAGAAALILAVANVEAAPGDPYADSVNLDAGAVDGTLNDVNGQDNGTFIQIGTEGSGGVGVVTVSFGDNVAFNGSGADLRIHVIDAVAAASALIEVTADGTTWIEAGTFADTADIDIDLGTLGTVLPFVTAVRLTQDSGVLPGFDLDAVEALHWVDLISLSFDADPNSAEPRILTGHTVTASLTHVIEAVDVPLVGVSVSFDVVSGPHAGVSFDDTATDSAGESAFFYLGNSDGGEDTIDVWLDIDGDGVFDGGEPGETVTAMWVGFTGTIELTDVDGDPTSTGDTLLVTVTDEDLDVTGAPDTVEVEVFSTTDLSGLMAMVLTENADTGGVFEGTVRLAGATTTGEPTLRAVAGDEVTARYDDVLDEDANDPEPETASVDVVGDTGTILLVDMDGPPLDAGDAMMVVVADADLDVSGVEDSIGVVVTSESGVLPLVLVETGPLTGIFRETFTLGEATDVEARVLAAVVGDTITATYDDELDANGEDPPAVEDSLVVTEEAEEDAGKVDVCHIPPGNPGNQHTLNIGHAALAAHLGHGDIAGVCDVERPGKLEKAGAKGLEKAEGRAKGPKDGKPEDGDDD
jgi:hypothetical protein